ncbi:MAG: winged helix-turn-helix domain-containing protein, partial [Gaiellaceae bacterium]
SGGPLSYADVSVEPLGHRAWRAGTRLDLTRTEFALLELFVRSAERVLSRSEILVAVWGYDFGPTSNSLEVYVGYLRRKLEEGGLPRLIHTVRGVGYVMRHEP